MRDREARDRVRDGEMRDGVRERDVEVRETWK